MEKSEHDNTTKSKSDSLTTLEQTLNLIKLGKGKGELKKLLKLSPSALSNRLKRLETLGCINLVGKYGIEITGCSPNNPKVTRTLIDKKMNKRGHGGAASIIFSQKNDIWENEKIKAEEKSGRIKKLDYGSFRLDYKQFTIIINRQDFSVWFKKDNSLFSKDALQSKFFMLKDLDNLAKYLKGRYELKGIYGISVFREHYGIILNKFAEWVLSKKRKLNVKNEGGKTVIWVDDSREDDVGLKELETNDALTANTMDEWGEDMDKEGWPLASDVKKNLSESSHQIKELAIQTKANADNVAFHMENMRSHVGATRDLSAATKKLNSNLEKQNLLFERIAEALEKGR